MAPTDSSSLDGDASSPPKSETAASLASIAKNLQRSAIQSTRTMQQNSSTHFRTIQNSLPEAVSQYRTYEDAFFNKVKDGLMVAREHPALGVGFVVSATYRTAICKAKRGGFKDSERANECRMAAFYAGFPETVPLRTVNRQRSFGLQAVTDVAAYIRAGFYDIGIGAGLELKHTRNSLVNELVPIVEFWDADKTVDQLKRIYMDTKDVSDEDSGLDCLPDVLLKLVKT
ncbi:Thiolase-like [Sesbania bispinosa]|nr:Thiolase-like [Sesbania bispinosa]